MFELAFSFAGTLLAGMAIGYYGGRWLDGWWGTTPWLQLAGLMLGAVAAFRVLWRTLQRAEEPPQEPPPGAGRHQDGQQDEGKEGHNS
ncbi:MAG TPA: AtpZ/AtpI family protein [Thermaerobacter sp.]